ncbi:Pycsar system effector family protein [Pontibacillus marinus]|uniref:Pycsar effector protein domain-containing protein n=1 Tax=Pontibacillus marinus BH030004 = DSM 16465 TaxID=1385511 RepID=A0A0A5HHK8_9BACI|nr:Pycsar system effector family protein [Pontibacillus marinus]KGX83132.1 hypothetical protein N783_06385 [Pontibacillus marinus BH030004 = DSM 16465]
MNKEEFSKIHHTYLNDYIKFADAKALALITINGLIIRVLFSYLTNNLMETKYFFALTSCILLLIAIFLAVLVVYPRTSDKNKKGLIFWENVSNMEKDNFLSELKEIDENELLNKFNEQNYFLACTASKKYSILRKGFLFTGLGFIGLIIAGLFWIFG